MYAKQVVQGKLRDQCCPYEIAACQRHLNDLKRQGTEKFPYVFDTTRADRITQWFGPARRSGKDFLRLMKRRAAMKNVQSPIHMKCSEENTINSWR